MRTSEVPLNCKTHGAISSYSKGWIAIGQQVLPLALCDMGNLCSPGMHMGLIDGTRRQGNQILTHATIGQGSKYLVFIHKLQTCTICVA